MPPKKKNLKDPKGSKKSKVNNKKDEPKFRMQDLLLVADAAIRHKIHPQDGPENAKVNLVEHHLNGYNSFVFDGDQGGNSGIEQIITELFSIEQTMINKREATAEDRKIHTIVFEVKFQRVRVEKPRFTDHWDQQGMVFFPNLARDRDLTYDAEITVDAKVTARAYNHKKIKVAEKEAEIKEHPIARIPVMVRSKICNTYGMYHQQLINIKEDPYDSGAYFVIFGTLWIIKNMESVKFNWPRFFLNIGHKNEVCRCEFLSRPGNRFENSAQLIIRLLANGNLTCEITIDKSVNKFKEVYIPFYLMFRILGVETDKEILQHIAHTDKGETAQKMLEILGKAFHIKYNHFENVLGVRKHGDVVKLIYDKTKFLPKEFCDKKRDVRYFKQTNYPTKELH